MWIFLSESTYPWKNLVGAHAVYIYIRIYAREVGEIKARGELEADDVRERESVAKTSVLQNARRPRPRLQLV